MGFTGAGTDTETETEGVADADGTAEGAGDALPGAISAIGNVDALTAGGIASGGGARRPATFTVFFNDFVLTCC